MGISFSIQEILVIVLSIVRKPRFIVVASGDALVTEKFSNVQNYAIDFLKAMNPL